MNDGAGTRAGAGSYSYDYGTNNAGHVRIFAMDGAPTQLPVPIPTMTPTPRPTSQPTLLPTPTQKEKDENDDRVVLRVRKSINSSLFLHSSTSFFFLSNKDKFNKHLSHTVHIFICVNPHPGYSTLSDGILFLACRCSWASCSIPFRVRCRCRIFQRQGHE